jgi:diacylglycerol kinase family enzyme
VGNPTAQSGKAARRIEQALEVFRHAGADVALATTEPEGRTVEALRARLDAEPCDVVVALGGDGTFAEVAKAVLAARAPHTLGFIPAGTANDLGRSLGLDPGALEANVATVLAGHVMRLDVGRIECLGTGDEVVAADYFFDSAGWGMQPDILATRNRDRRAVAQIPLLRDIYRDAAVFAGATLEHLLASVIEPVAFEAEIVADGQRTVWSGLTDLVLNATPVYAGYWVLDRRSEPDDGRFELVPIRGRAHWLARTLRDLRALSWADALAALRAAGDESISAARFEIRFERPDIAVQIDGDPWHAGGRYRADVLPGRLPLLAPRDFVPPWRPS